MVEAQLHWRVATEDGHEHRELLGGGLNVGDDSCHGGERTVGDGDLIANGVGDFKDALLVGGRLVTATLLLTGVSVGLTLLVSLPLGIFSAVNQNRWGDWVIRSLSFVGNSIPNFFAALLLLYIFAIQLQWLPVISRQLTVESVILPASTLALAMSAKYIRQVRATVLDELSKDYVLAARARGIPFAATLIFSVLRSSLVTIITLLMLSIGSLLGGTAIVESIFMWDGVGKLAVDAINMRDYPMIQAYVMWMAIIYVCVNLMTDLSYQWLDPRIRLGRGVS